MRRHDIIRSYLQKIRPTASSDLESLAEGDELESIREVGLEGFLAGNVDLDEDKLDSLEAIVLPKLRPTFFVKGFDSVDGDWPDWQDAMERIRPVLRATMRIESVNKLFPYHGTGFLVGERLLLTNRHVASAFIAERGMAAVRFETLYKTWAAPRRERDPAESPSAELLVRGALWVHPYWDAALLEIEPSDVLKDIEPLELVAEEPKSLQGRKIVVVGHPYKGSYEMNSQGPIDERDIFGGEAVRGVKRAQPGELRGTTLRNALRVLEHDASTLQGNSGSPVLDLDTGKIIGLHYSGLYLQGNYAVPSWELARDTRVSGSRVRFAGTPRPDQDPVVLRAWGGEEPPPAPLLTSAPAARFRESPLDWYQHTDESAKWQLALSDPKAFEQRVRAALGAEHGSEVAKAIRALAMDAEQLNESPKLPAGTPEIVYLHGLFGGHLSWQGTREKRLWLSPWTLATMDIGEALLLREDGFTDANVPQGARIGPAGLVDVIYDVAAYWWRQQGFVVHEFSYDWRKSVAHAADRLHAFIEGLHAAAPGTRYAIVAHSMGGTVALQYAHAHREALQRVDRAIFLGSPLQGAFEPIGALLGSNRFANKLAMITPSTRDGLTRLARACPGLIDMLPSGHAFPDTERLYHRSSWPEGGAPLQRWLDQSRALKASLRASPLIERSAALITVDRRTVAGLSPGEPLAMGPAEWAGDGVVPALSAVLPGMAAWAVDFSHSQLPLDPKVISGVVEILLDGRPAKARPVRPDELERRIGAAVETIELPRGEEGFHALGASELLWLFSEDEAQPLSEVDAWVDRLKASAADEGQESVLDIEEALDAADPDTVYAALERIAREENLDSAIEPGDEGHESLVQEAPSGIEEFGEAMARPWSDWLGGNLVRTKGAVKVASVEALQQLVRLAHQSSVQLKVTGDRHSDNDLAQPAHFRVDLSKLSGLLPVDHLKPAGPDWPSHVQREHLRRFGAGTTVAEVNALLDAPGPERRALPNMGSYDGQHIIGALCTGTHGSGAALGPLADLIVSMDVVNELGELERIEPAGGISAGVSGLVQDTARFEALKMGLGMLGIVVSVTLQVRMPFDLCERRVAATWAVTQRRYRERLAAYPHYEILINPYPTSPRGDWREEAPNDPGYTTIETLRWEPKSSDSGVPVPDAPEGDEMVEGARNPMLRFAKDGSRKVIIGLMNRLPRTQPWFLNQALKALRVPWKDRGPYYRDVSHRVLKLGLGVKAHGCEIAVPIDRLEEAVDIILSVAARYHKHPNKRSRSRLTSPFSVRFVAASLAPIAPQSRGMGEPSPGKEVDLWAMIELPRLFGTKRPHAVVDEIERRLKEIGGRPHWGQHNDIRRGEPERMYPRWGDFAAQFSQHNRAGIFSNALSRRLGLDREELLEEALSTIPPWDPGAHIVNFEGEGYFSTSGSQESSLGQLKWLFEIALPDSKRDALVLYAHGGLVGEAGGVEGAKKLTAHLLAQTKAYPICVVWETGLGIVPQVITDLFRREGLARKLLWWVVRAVGRALLPEWDALWAALTGGTEATEASPPGEGLVDLSREDFDVERLEGSLREEMQHDIALEGALRSISTGEESVGSGLDPAFLRSLSPGSGEEAITAAGLFVFARYAARIAWRVWQRKRSTLGWNGLKQTILEEVLRDVGAHVIGQVGWSRMKRNALSAYEPSHDGEQLIDCIVRWLRERPGRTLHLVAHSAGSFHLGAWLTHLCARIPASERPVLVDNLVLLAPACDTSFFARHVLPHETRVGRMAMFALTEEQEDRSQMIPVLYDQSLLCIVSGLFEEKWGWPILGMMRAHDKAEGDIADAVRTTFGKPEHILVRAPTGEDAPLGRQNTALTHSDVDDKAMDSLAVLITSARTT